jgi:hypothetical protein
VEPDKLTFFFNRLPRNHGMLKNDMCIRIASDTLISQIMTGLQYCMQEVDDGLRRAVSELRRDLDAVKVRFGL